MMEVQCVSHDKLLADFPVLSRTVDGRNIIYLDNAASSLRPRQTMEAMMSYYHENGANIHRGKHYLSEESSVAYEQARYSVAQFINCAGNEVVFVRNTTEALNLVASGLGLSKEDRIVACLDAHHSAILPWMRCADLKLARYDEHGLVDVNHYQDLLKAGPRVVVITHCSNVTGLYAPLEEMTRLAKEVGAIVVVDGAQSVPHRQIDVHRMNIDFLAFSGHKMLGPTGIGVLFGKAALLNTLEPTYLGGGMVDWVDLEGYRLRKIPHRFEAGTPDIGGAYGLAAAINYLTDIGLNRIEVHDTNLGKLLVSEAIKRERLEVLGTTNVEDRGAIVSLRLRNCSDHGEIARILSDSYGIMCRTGYMCAQPLIDFLTDGEVLRCSAYLYNTSNDILSFFSALDEISVAYDWSQTGSLIS